MQSQNNSSNKASNICSNFNNSYLDSIKINYYPLLPFLSYDNIYNLNKPNFGLDINLLNDYSNLKNYIKVLSEQKSWQQFSSYIISNIENVNKKIIFQNKSDNNEKNLIGVKRKSINNEKNIDNKSKNDNDLKNKTIDKKDNINDNNEKIICNKAKNNENIK